MRAPSGYVDSRTEEEKKADFEKISRELEVKMEAKGKQFNADREDYLVRKASEK
jgi:hypothetical protein